MVLVCHRESAPTARVIESHRALVLSLLFLAALLFMSAQARAATSQCEARAARGHETLLPWTLANWEPLDDRTVVIWTEHSPRASLVKLARPLDGLTSASIITLIAGHGDRTISPCGHDALMIGQDESTVAQIVSITRLSERRTAALDQGQDIPRMQLSRI